MKSIRLTLIVYFLALLAVALGAVAGLVYWTTSGIVQARQDATLQLVRSQHGQRVTEVHGKLLERPVVVFRDRLAVVSGDVGEQLDLVRRESYQIAVFN